MATLISLHVVERILTGFQVWRKSKEKNSFNEYSHQANRVTLCSTAIFEVLQDKICNELNISGKLNDSAGFLAALPGGVLSERNMDCTLCRRHRHDIILSDVTKKLDY